MNVFIFFVFFFLLIKIIRVSGVISFYVEMMETFFFIRRQFLMRKTFRHNAVINISPMLGGAASLKFMSKFSGFGTNFCGHRVWACGAATRRDICSEFEISLSPNCNSVYGHVGNISYASVVDNFEILDKRTHLENSFSLELSK